ncbi:hypothetical protein [Peribacillus sp. NPDC097295]
MIIEAAGIVINLLYKESSNCLVVMNFIMTGNGEFVWLQGHAYIK